MAELRWRIFLLSAVILVAVDSSQDIMKNLTIGFSKVLEECKKEANVNDEVLQDFYNFWKEEYALVHREMGCVLMCMVSKLDLISDDMKLHHGKAHEFAKTHGADDAMAKQLISILHECESANAGAAADDCARVLEIAKCFKTRIHDLKWAPSMEVMLGEVMTDM